MLNVLMIIIDIITVLVVLLVSVSSLGERFFNRKVRAEVQGFLAKVKQHGSNPILQADLNGLPTPVQKWLEHSGVVGTERVTSVRLIQKGSMRMKPEQKWMPFNAVQYFSIEKPGFIWQVKVKYAPFIFFVGRDQYQDGHGHMLIKLLSVIPLVGAQGNEMDQGTLLRYLAEMTWFPSGFLHPYIKWEGIDDHSARATMTYGGVSESGVFTFNDDYDLSSFTAPRYMESGGSYTKEIWSIQVTGYKDFQGIRVPSKGNVTWKLKAGDFTWLEYEIEDMEYNKPVMYK